MAHIVDGDGIHANFIDQQIICHDNAPEIGTLREFSDFRIAPDQTRCCLEFREQSCHRNRLRSAR